MQKLRDIVAWIREDRRRTIAAIVVALLLVSSIWYLVSRNAKSKTPQYQTARVEKGSIVSSVSASGQILSSNFVNIGTQATGLVQNVYVKDGDRVYAGQRIAEIRLDSDGALVNAKAWASLVSAQNSLNSANNNYRGTQATLANVYDQVKGHDTDETFAQRDIRTKAEVANDNAWDAIKGAQANLASASLSYQQMSPVIVAPTAGTVDNITITPGMVLTNTSSSTSGTSSQRVAVIRAEGSPIATFNVSEVDVSRVKPGQKATITLDSIPNKTFTGKVLTVDKIGTVSSGVTNYPVTIAFDTGNEQILPNMSASANIIIDSKDNVLLVPSAAVTTQDGQSTVEILKNGQAQTVSVEIGLSSDTQIEITSGLSEGDTVITGTVSQASSQGLQTSPFSTFRVGGGGGGLRVGGGGR